MADQDHTAQDTSTIPGFEPDAPGVGGVGDIVLEHTQTAEPAPGYGLVLGRYIEHPPEPPHLIQIWYKLEQDRLKKDYADANPGVAVGDIKVVENWVELRDGAWVEVEGQSPTAAQVLHGGTLREPLPLVGYAPWENHAYLGIGAIAVILFFAWLTAGLRRDPLAMMRRPSRTQMVVEMIAGAFDDFCKGMLGEKNGRIYMPYIASLFMLILFCNFMGMIPLMRAPTSSLVITGSLAICTFFVVQATAWIRLGPLTYIHHLMGSPKDLIGWFLAPLFLLLELISDFIAKPLSLALRLFGNIFGKDILLGAFLGMGIMVVVAISETLGSVFGIPFTIPFYFLGMLLSTIQALVFALLSTIYISLVLPHDHDHEEHEHEEVHSPVPAGAVHERVPS